MKKFNWLLVAVLALTLSCKKDKGGDVAVFAGGWSGSFDGDDQGHWSVSISEDGAISGTGTSHRWGNTFILQGNVAGDGGFKATVGTVDTGSEFVGNLTEGGMATGTWKNTGVTPHQTGTWTGSRDPD